MGGAAALITISSTGEVDTTMAYNAGMAELSINYDLINEKDPLKRDQIIKTWMQKNQRYMDKEYGRPGFTPEWYGLIIIDNKNKRLIEHQSYTKLCMVLYASLKLIENGQLIGDHESITYEPNQVLKFLLNDQLVLRIASGGKLQDKKIPTSIKTIDSLLRFTEKNMSKKFSMGFAFYAFDTCDWEHIDMETSGPSSETMKNFYKYCNDNYADLMTKKDHMNWKKYLKNLG